MAAPGSAPSPAPAPPGPDRRDRPTLADLAGRVQSLALTFSIALFATVVVDLLWLPWRLAELFFGVVALVSGIRLLLTLARLRRLSRGQVGGGGRVGVVVGLAWCLLIVVSGVSEAAFYPLVAEHEECQARALTVQAQTHCRDSLSRRIEDLKRRLGVPLDGGLTPTTSS